MYTLVYWIDEKQYSVVDISDVVLDENAILETGMTVDVKWREKRGRTVSESTFQAKAISISGKSVHDFIPLLASFCYLVFLFAW